METGFSKNSAGTLQPNEELQKYTRTGGAGFIGSYLVDTLVEKGYSVTILDNLEEQVHQGKKPGYLNPKAKFIKGDVLDHSTLKRVLKNVDVVYHLASAVGVAQSNYEIKKYADVNVGATADLLDIIVNSKLPIKKIISVASMTGYGEGNYLCSACGVVRPPTRSKEQLSKKQWELYCPNCNKSVKPVPTDETAQEYPNSVYAITKKAKSLLGWKPRIGLKEGIGELVRWGRNQEAN